MNRTERERLLKETLTGDEVSGFRQTTLELGLRALKTRQKRRAAVRVCIVCSLALVFGGEIVRESVMRLSARRDSVETLPQASTATAPAPSGTDEVKFISDNELMALFPDRAVALIGKPGHQQLVFLDLDKTAADYE
ncbi:MAG TPA: hypothetical protein VNZ64_08735 [Candidatus Acidoferrum sp.]|jgi:hypothetical protein|nr:hypothetical protein [Candidatus Acidoferrum sp.]